MSTIAEIKAAIEGLSPRERIELKTGSTPIGIGPCLTMTRRREFVKSWLKRRVEAFHRVIA
jgi:hypothetical protein